MSKAYQITARVLGVGVALAIAAGPLAAGEATPRAPASDLSDAEIAHVAVTANRIDAEIAELAVTRAAGPAVRQFAETMITDHTAVNERAAELAQRLGVTPEDNAVSQALDQEARETRGRLSALEGAAFDRAYIEHEVAYHRAVLEVLDETLIPGAENAELRSLLQEVRPVIAAHLEHAESIQAGLGGER